MKWLDIKQLYISDAHIYLEVSTGKTENDDLYLTPERHETVLTLGSCVCTSLALAAAAEECEVFRK